MSSTRPQEIWEALRHVRQKFTPKNLWDCRPETPWIAAEHLPRVGLPWQVVHHQVVSRDIGGGSFAVACPVCGCHWIEDGPEPDRPDNVTGSY